jgi:hypothetical protein
VLYPGGRDWAPRGSADDLIDQLIIPFFLQPWCSTLVDETGHHVGQLMTLLIS